MTRSVRSFASRNLRFEIMTPKFREIRGTEQFKNSCLVDFPVSNITWSAGFEVRVVYGQ